MSRAKRRLLALNGLDDDIGEQASLVGLAALLDEVGQALTVDIVLDQTNLDEFLFRPETIATLNESYDLVMLGPGGVLGPTAQGSYPFHIGVEDLDRFEVPFGLFAAGVADVRFGGGWDPEARAHLEETLRAASFVTVRDGGTRRALASLVGGPILPACMPDPAILAVPDRDAMAVPGLDDRPVVALALHLDGVAARFGEPFEPRFEAFIRMLLETLGSLTEEHGCQVLYAPLRRSVDDLELANLLRAVLADGAVHILPELLPSLYDGSDFGGPSRLGALFARSELVLAQHVYAPVLAANAGTPFVSLSSTDALTFTHAELGAPAELLLDLADPASLSGDALLSACRKALADGTRIRSEGESRRAELVERLRRFGADILERSLRIPVEETHPTPAVAL